MLQNNWLRQAAVAIGKKCVAKIFAGLVLRFKVALTPDYPEGAFIFLEPALSGGIAQAVTYYRLKTNGNSLYTSIYDIRNEDGDKTFVSENYIFESGLHWYKHYYNDKYIYKGFAFKLEGIERIYFYGPKVFSMPVDIMEDEASSSAECYFKIDSSSRGVREIYFMAHDFEFPWDPSYFLKECTNLQKITISRTFYEKVKAGIPDSVKVVFNNL